jgi:Tol biopolymer transport system component
MVAQRPSVDAPWGPPVNLGPSVNTPFNEGGPNLSLDGHRLYFQSNRPGGFGGTDLYVSHRTNRRDDFAWQPAANLGSLVNTAFNENTSADFEDDETGVLTLYFTSNRPGGLGGDDIYASTLQPDGTFGPAAAVVELNSASIDRQPAIRRDGLEMFLASDRAGSFGALDLWVSTRSSKSDPWSPPVNLGPLVNSTIVDAGPGLSFDGTTLYFQSARPGGSGPCVDPDGSCEFDLWVTTRTKLKLQ